MVNWFERESNFVVLTGTVTVEMTGLFPFISLSRLSLLQLVGKTLGRTRGIGCRHLWIVLGTSEWQPHEKNYFPAVLALLRVLAVSERSFNLASNPSPNSSLPQSGNSSLPKDDKVGFSLVRTCSRLLDEIWGEVSPTSMIAFLIQ